MHPHHVRLVLLVLIAAALYVALDHLAPIQLTGTGLLFKMEVVFIYALVLSAILTAAMQPFIIWLMLKTDKSS